MSSGKTHNWANAWLGGGLLALALYLHLPFLVGIAIAAGCLVNGKYLSPDLDLPYSIPSKNWGKLRSLWYPYRTLVGRHRSWISHSPILSTFVRVVYLLGWVAIALSPVLLLLHNKIPAETWEWITRDRSIHVIAAFYLGLELSTDLHLLLDWGYSTRKKLIKHRM